MDDTTLAEGLESIETTLEALMVRAKELREQIAPGSTSAASRSPGERLVLARNQAGLSQQMLAERSGVSVNAIIGFENGRTKPRPRTLMALAKEVGVPWEILKEDDDERDREG